MSENKGHYANEESTDGRERPGLSLGTENNG